MERIEIERRPPRPLLLLLVTLALIALIAIGVVVYVEGRRAALSPAPGDTATETVTRPPAF